ncbi:hypothetical protein J3E69DRAFT_110327 [Trichoderma sp. SZMC 28015]
MPICPYYYTFSTSTWASDSNGANNHSTAIAIQHDCARSPQNRSCSPIPFFQDKTLSDSCSHAIPKTATIPSGTYESYTASRIGIRTTLSRLTYASFHGVLLLPPLLIFFSRFRRADLVPRLACFDQRQVLTGGASPDRAHLADPLLGACKWASRDGRQGPAFAWQRFRCRHRPLSLYLSCRQAEATLLVLVSQLRFPINIFFFARISRPWPLEFDNISQSLG